MNILEKRVNKVEVIARLKAGDLQSLSDAELEQRTDSFLARMGTTREMVVAEHGSLSTFADVLRREVQHGTA